MFKFVKVAVFFFLLLVIPAIIGCGGVNTSSQTSSSQTITMQTGQWEINAGQDQNGDPLYIEANIQSQSNTTYFSTPVNTVEYSFGGYVSGYVNETQSNGSVQIVISQDDNVQGTINPPFSQEQTPDSGTFSGILNTDGNQIAGTIQTVNVFTDEAVNGPFSAYLVTPVSGTFVVTPNNNDTTISLTISITNGVVSGSGIFEDDSFVILSASQSNFDVGAVFEAQATIQTPDGSFPIQLIGRQNQSGNQINLAVDVEENIQINTQSGWGGYEGVDVVVVNKVQQ